MNKEEILAKAKQEGILGVDDGSKHMKDYGRLVGKLLFFAVFIIIALLSIATKHEIDYGVQAMFLAYISGEAYAQWKFKKSKAFLFLSIVGVITTIFTLIYVACTMFGVTP